VQTAVGLVIVALGVLHFLDRGRPRQEVRSYYLGAPSTPGGRAALALMEVAIGFLLLFTS
jgi:hypothetical protein